MRRHLLGLMCFTLAACSPVYVTAPAGSGDVLPVEAQRVIDHATATAAVEATRNAQATATDQSARKRPQPPPWARWAPWQASKRKSPYR